MPPVRLIKVRLELDKYKRDEEVKRLASKDGGKVVSDLSGKVNSDKKNGQSLSGTLRI